MINYNIDLNKLLMQVYPNISSDKLITAYFIPVEQIGPLEAYNYDDIGEFTHFGKLDLEDNDLNEYDSTTYENEDIEEPYDSFSDLNNFSLINESNVETLEDEALNNTPSDYKRVIRKDRSKTKGFSTFKKYYDKVETYLPEAKKYRDLLTEIAYQESRFRSGIINRIGAAGYFQFMDSTRREILKRLKKSTNLNDFLNNPELQIVAAVQLAKSFENSFSLNDLQIALRKGHTLNGLISGAWLGGIGGVRKYLYKGRNASDGGTTILARIKLGDLLYTHNSSNILSNISWAKGVANDISLLKTLLLMLLLPKFNIKSSNPKYWTYKNPTKSAHNCGKAVRLYMESRGITTVGRPTYGGDYGPYLLSTGWQKLSPNDTPKFGDVCVTKGQGNNREGHISMYDGNLWVSDYVLSGPLVYSWAKIGVNTNFYRYKG